MAKPPGDEGALPLAEAVREACVAAALVGYEDAAIGGLCGEGAFEAALGAMQRLDLPALARETCERAASPAGRKAEPRAAPPATPGAAAQAALAGAGVCAGALLGATASACAARGPEAFRTRARTLASRAENLEAALGALSRHAATAADAEALAEIAGRCAQLATLAAELAGAAPDPEKPAAQTAAKLAASASEAALALGDHALAALPESDTTLGTRRRLWRASLLLGRVTGRS